MYCNLYCQSMAKIVKRILIKKKIVIKKLLIISLKFITPDTII